MGIYILYVCPGLKVIGGHIYINAHLYNKYTQLSEVKAIFEEYLHLYSPPRHDFQYLRSI